LLKFKKESFDSLAGSRGSFRGPLAALFGGWAKKEKLGIHILR
jgi:hypothetical protein